MLIWTGTAAVESGSATVVVDSGAALTAEVVTYGAMVVLDGIVYFAGSLTDTSTLELTRDYAGSTGTVDMEIWPVSQDTTNLVNLAQVVARTQAQINILDKNSQGLFFYMKGVTGAADPGPGFIAFDDADADQVTEAYVDALDANGRTVSELVALWEAGTTVVVRSLSTTAYRAYTVATNTAESGYANLAMTYVGHDGVLADNEALSISWSRAAAGLEINASGNFADRDTYDDEPAGFVFLSADGDGDTITVGTLFRKNSGTTADWGPAVPFQGPQGARGWSPIFSVVNDGTRRVLRLVDYVGGEDPKPTTGINQYVSAGGLTGTIGSATDIRGPQGLSAYEVAVVAGFAGTEEEWLATLIGASAYQVAVAAGFVGDEAAWLASLNGADGTDPGALFNWDDGTADEDPGAGNIRADNADLSAAAFLYVSKEGRTGDDLEAFLLGIGSSTNTIKGHVTLTSSGGAAQAIIRVVSLTDATGYVKIGLQDTTHAGVTSFTDSEPVSLQFSLAGNQGAADEVSVASAINGSAEVTDPDAATKFAITDPNNGDLLSWVSLETLSDVIKPRALVDAQTANFTVTVAELGKNLNVDASAANRTITLLPVATAGNGFEIGVRKSDSSANTVTIDGDGSETINGLTTLVLRSQRESVRLVCDGTAWFVSSTGAAFGGDSGAGGRIGSVPPPSAGDAAAGKVLGAGGSWVTPAGDVSFEQLLTYQSTLALEMAEDRTTGPVSAGPDGNGLFDGFNILDYVDVAGATNLDTGTAGELAPTETSGGTDSSAASTGTTSFNDLSIGDRSWTVDNSKTVSKIGSSRTSALAGCKVLVVQRTGTGTYDIIASEDFNHPGGGYYDKVLNTPVAIPASGTFHVMIYSPSNVSPWDIVASTNRMNVASVPTGTGVAISESNGNAPVLRVEYAGTVNDLTVESDLLTLSEAPDFANVFAIAHLTGATLNTDLVFSVSRDGSDFGELTMTEIYQRPDGSSVLSSGAFELSALDSGTTGQWRITTDNGARSRILAVGISFGVQE